MPIRVGVIGLDYGAQVHVPAFKENPRYEVTAVASRAAGRAEAFAREQGIARWYADPRQLIHSDLDLVSIATPPATHSGYAVMALANRRHVLSEIAFMPSAADARVVTESAERVKRVGAAAFVLRYTPLLRHITDLLKAGAIGRPRLMTFDFFSNFLDLPDDNNRWIWDADNGGGVLAGYTAHALDLGQRWFGPVREVEATLSTLTSVSLPAGLKNAADDTGAVTLLFQAGVVGLFRHSAVTALPRTQIELHGTEGSLLITGFGDEAALLRMGAEAPETLFPPVPYLEETRGHSGLAGAFGIFLEQLAQAITEHSLPPDLPTFADGLQVTRLIEAARLASREKRRVALSEI
ncbi:MAG: Gfo/Idh/MocA family oxidoreductase [Anaerolineales bacterium]|nr:Gfo/Idh/MocA family oxidoreductase [Anaerolineales bacterium]